MAATTPEFVNLTSPGWWSRTHAQDTRDDGPIAVEQLSLLQENVDHLTLLDNDHCQAAFNSSNLQPKYLNVLLVTNFTGTDALLDSAIWTVEDSTKAIMPWFFSVESVDVDGCGPWIYSYGSNWSIPVLVETVEKGIILRRHISAPPLPRQSLPVSRTNEPAWI